MRVDLHTHILPKDWPDWAAMWPYGDGRFIRPEPGTEDGRECLFMKQGDTLFRRVWSTCYDPGTILGICDQLRIDRQVVCTVPVLFGYWAKQQHTLEISRFLNDHLADTVRDHPRFIALGTVPLNDTELAINELRRCVNDLNFPGVQIGSHVEHSPHNGLTTDRNLGDPELLPFWQAADDLGAAVFVHPWDMMGHEQMREYWLPWLVGMPAETCRAACSLIFAGVMERLPNLRVCLAHAGGTLPYTIGRIEHGYNTRPDLCAANINRSPREFLRSFYYDSATHDPQPLRYLLDLVGPDRVALGSDFPFPLGEHQPGSMIDAMHLDEHTREHLFWKTAQDFLAIPLHETPA